LALDMQLASGDGMSRLDFEVVADYDIDNYRVGNYSVSRRVAWTAVTCCLQVTTSSEARRNAPHTDCPLPCASRLCRIRR